MDHPTPPASAAAPCRLALPTAGLAGLLALAPGCDAGAESAARTGIASAVHTAVEMPKAPAASSQAVWLAPAKCTPPKVKDATQLLPDGLMFVGQFDLANAARGVFGPELEKVKRGKPKMRSAFDAMKLCGLTGTGIGKVTIAAQDENEIAVIAEAPGLADETTLRCLHREIEKATGESPWKEGTAACTTALDLDDGSMAYAVGHDMLVITSKAVDKRVRERLGGRGTGALDGGFKWARKAVDMKRTAWFAMDVPPELAGASAGLARLAGSVDAAKGLDVSMSANFDTRTQAEEAASKLSMVTAMGPMMGLPTTLMDTFTVDRKGDTVTMEVFISPSDLETLKSIAQGTP